MNRTGYFYIPIDSFELCSGIELNHWKQIYPFSSCFQNLFSRIGADIILMLAFPQLKKDLCV